jgi:hypothetical protein
MYDCGRRRREGGRREEEGVRPGFCTSHPSRFAPRFATHLDELHVHAARDVVHVLLEVLVHPLENQVQAPVRVLDVLEAAGTRRGGRGKGDDE